MRQGKEKGGFLKVNEKQVKYPALLAVRRSSCCIISPDEGFEALEMPREVPVAHLAFRCPRARRAVRAAWRCLSSAGSTCQELPASTQHVAAQPPICTLLLHSRRPREPDICHDGRGKGAEEGSCCELSLCTRCWRLGTWPKLPGKRSPSPRVFYIITARDPGFCASGVSRSQVANTSQC